MRSIRRPPLRTPAFKPPQDLRILGRIFTLQHRQIHKKNAPAACADTINQNKFTNFYHFRTMRIFRLQLFLSGFQAGKWHVRTKLSYSTADIIFCDPIFFCNTYTVYSTLCIRHTYCIYHLR